MVTLLPLTSPITNSHPFSYAVGARCIRAPAPPRHHFPRRHQLQPLLLRQPPLHPSQASQPLPLPTPPRQPDSFCGFERPQRLVPRRSHSTKPLRASPAPTRAPFSQRTPFFSAARHNAHERPRLGPLQDRGAGEAGTRSPPPSTATPHRYVADAADAAHALLDAFFQRDPSGELFFPFPPLEKKERAILRRRQQGRQSMIQTYLKMTTEVQRQKDRDSGRMIPTG